MSRSLMSRSRRCMHPSRTPLLGPRIAATSVRQPVDGNFTHDLAWKIARESLQSPCLKLPGRTCRTLGAIRYNKNMVL